MEDRFKAEIVVHPDRLASVALRGRLNSQTVAELWPSLQEGLYRKNIAALNVDVSEVAFCDGAGLALLRYLDAGKLTPDAKVTVSGMRDELARHFRGFTLADYQAARPDAAPKHESLPGEIGQASRLAAKDLAAQISFVGEIAAGLPPALIRRKRMRWAEVGQVFEVAGANALPIVSLMSVLVGLVIAFEAAQPMAEFGAQLYVANLIGLVMVRELGPLVAAVMLAGRSGSAFAAELGTMKVNEELNALATFGIDPVRYLVIQRIVGAVLLSPLLTFYAMFMGILGGVLVMLALGFPLTLVWHQLSSSVHLADLIFGAIKGTVFGAIVAMVGCLRGLQTQQGPSAVGISTTRAVVTSILLIVIVDAVFSVLFYLLR